MAEVQTLEKFVAEGRKLLDISRPVEAHDDFVDWDRMVAEWFDKNYPSTGLSALWSARPFSALVVGGAYSSDAVSWMHFKATVQNRLGFLAEAAQVINKLKRGGATKAVSGVSNTSKVFVVHGHDEEMKQAVARLLTIVDLEPIILHEQPNKAKTLIEKFEANSDVNFAVILLSPDDIGYPKALPASAKSRPRQNVVLELGYFVGRLGRERVCALKREDDLELPSDISGVAYTPYDRLGNWRYELVRELRAAGYSVDANKLMP